MECPACHTPNADGARFCAKCGALLPAAKTEEADPLVGTVVGGRFRILGVLGEGGMGIVYNGEQQMGTSVRKVAVKTLLAQYAKDPQVVARFMRECGTVSELEHPNTIRVYDFGQTPTGELYIAMELLSGVSLEKALESGALAAERVDKIVGQVCGSLQEAHDKGIVHRDLKPANIYLTVRAGEEDYVKVLDFGIAKRDDKHSKHEAKLTQQGTVLGTPPYMSPEQFRGHELDARSDIYSLGVMAYEMLTGRLPFDADTPWAWATQHMTAQPFPFETVPIGSAVPNKMKGAVMRALSKDKSHRHQSVRDFFEEFTMGGGRTSALSMPRPSGADLAAANAGAVARGPGMPTPQTQISDPAFTPIGAVPTGPLLGTAQTSPQAQYPSYPGAPAGYPGVPTPIGATAVGGVPTGSGQVFQPPPPPKKSSAGLIFGVLGAVAVVGLVVVGGVFALRGRGSSGGEATATTAKTSAPVEDAGAPPATATTTSAPVLPPPTVPTQRQVDPASAQACRSAELHANRNELPAARSAFARCEGPGKVGARYALEQAEIRARGKLHSHGQGRCPPGKRCPR